MPGVQRRAQQRGGRSPAVTGTEPRPTNDATARAFAVVLASSTLPATVVRPASSISGDPAAKAIASASSMPGSQSRMMVVLMAVVLSVAAGGNKPKVSNGPVFHPRRSRLRASPG